MRRLLKLLGTVVAAVLMVLAGLATIGYLKGGKRAREAGPSSAGAVVRAPDAGAVAARGGAGAASTGTLTPGNSVSAGDAVSTVGNSSTNGDSASTPGNSVAGDTRTTVGNRAVVGGAPAVRTASEASAAAFIRGLDVLEAQGKHADAAVDAFKEIPSLSWSGRVELIAWLKARVKDGRMPAMYWIARAYSYNGDGPEAAKWYAAAGLAGRIDAARLTDVSAASAMPAVETHFAEIKKALKDDAVLRRTALAWALEHEESVKDRKVAGWIAAHGMDSFRGGTPTVIGDEAWKAKRATLRESYRKMGAE